MSVQDWICKSPIAHRGLHTKLIPENSLEAFENAKRHNFPIELDVHLLKDNTIVVFHDSNLKRLTGKDGLITDLSKCDLSNYHLHGTKNQIPTFEEVLACVNGNVPILIEIKNDSKVGVLEEKLIQILHDYNGPFAVQSFNPFSLGFFKKNAPNILRGQLSGYFQGEKLAFYKKYVLKRLMLANVSRPDFISYEATTLPNKFTTKFENLPLLAWTVRSQQEYDALKNYCTNIIFENFIPDTSF